MKYNFPYTLHDYLDRELAIYDGNPPVHIIVAKKKEYRKLYSIWYRKEYYARIKQVTVQFGKAEYLKIKSEAKSLGIRVSTYIKSKLKEESVSHSSHALINMKLMAIIDIIEECLHEGEFSRLHECLLVVESIQKELL